MLIQSPQVESQVFATKKGVVNDLLHCQGFIWECGEGESLHKSAAPPLKISKKYYGDSYLPPYFTTLKFRPPLNNFLNETLTVLCMLRSMT